MLTREHFELINGFSNLVLTSEHFSFLLSPRSSRLLEMQLRIRTHIPRLRARRRKLLLLVPGTLPLLFALHSHQSHHNAHAVPHIVVMVGQRSVHSAPFRFLYSHQSHHNAHAVPHIVVMVGQRSVHSAPFRFLCAPAPDMHLRHSSGEEKPILIFTPHTRLPRTRMHRLHGFGKDKQGVFVLFAPHTH